MNIKHDLKFFFKNYVYKFQSFHVSFSFIHNIIIDLNQTFKTKRTEFD